MKNTFGSALLATLFGESRGDAVGIVLDGLTPGMPVDEKEIEKQLARRRPSYRWETGRREPDHFLILSGVYRGKTTGTPLALVIPNEDVRNDDPAYGAARPSHADYTGYAKYHGFEDHRGGGHFSGRVTAALVAAGGILIPALEKKGIVIGSHIASCGGVSDRPFNAEEEDIQALRSLKFPVLEQDVAVRMQEVILAAKQAGDSVGGITETTVCGLPAGVGEPWFDSLESVLSHALFGIGGIKGVSFGDGFALSDMRGSQANDALVMENGVVRTRTNHGGGICGGISNGMPIRFRCAVKPTPSIAMPQETVDFIKQENISISVNGRHDPAIISRICPVIDAVTALVLSDLLLGRFGCDYFGEEEG